MKNRFCINDFETKERFYKLPKEIVNHSKYKGLTNAARIMYAILRDRTELSYKNGWIDEKGHVYIIFTIENLQKLLNVSHTTIIKVKKELTSYSLLEESRLGMNKPNRLYLLKPESLANSGVIENGTPKSCVHEFKNLEGNDTEYSDTKIIKDTNKDTSMNFNSFILEQAELNLQTGMISKKTIRIFKVFNNSNLLKELIDIIYSTKKKVENFENKENHHEGNFFILGDIWMEEIDKQAFKFLQKVKEYEHKEKPIKDLKKYWYKMMETFWENVLLMMKKYGFTKLEMWYQTNELEVEQSFVEFNELTKNLSNKEKKKKRYELIYQSKF